MSAAPLEKTAQVLQLEGARAVRPGGRKPQADRAGPFPKGDGPSMRDLENDE